MKVFFEFFYKFGVTLLTNIGDFFINLWKGFLSIFNFGEYLEILNTYKEDFDTVGWIATIIVMLIFLGIVVILVWRFIVALRRFAKKKRTRLEKEELMEQISDLNNQVFKLIDEKEKIMAMKVSQLGLKPGEDIDVGGDDGVRSTADSRFTKLIAVDREYEEHPFAADQDFDFTLEQFAYSFRNFACSKLKLFYDIKTVRLFISAMATSRMIILEGISGTGKTSLPYAFGKFLAHPSAIIPVQPSWRDKTELIGYLNEFTKKFNETDFLKVIYEAGYRDDIGFVVLDEMNLARVEYYFAEVLSILEMPDRTEWLIDIVPDVWATDPKLLLKGKLRIPSNTWFIGTANNDDSTFSITDKVYDRAVPIQINTKGVSFEAKEQEAVSIRADYLEMLFNKAYEEHAVSSETLSKFEQLDDYVISHFRLAFGNRILKQVKAFVPAFVGCGGTEIDGLDYMFTYKILRKFEGLNISYNVETLTDLISFLTELFGEGTMTEAKEFLTRLIKAMS